ncbi:hypothetical protein ACFXGT_08220 [Streptomyces sp. NPDC059352]|uniref:hypothetical protein n=1 Tax=Streptomyces sp. NPDC059352 TaxID=3346810 RepID=UPI0036847491
MTQPTDRTTKRVTGTFTLTFHGSYIDADDIPQYFEEWVDGSLEDRDDLRGWKFDITEIDEVTGDPEGFDT